MKLAFDTLPPCHALPVSLLPVRLSRSQPSGRAAAFQKPGDYDAFERVLIEALERHPICLLGYCVMPNHWHFALWPERDGQLTEFLRWLTHTHTQRWHAHYHSAGTGHLYQGRFKSFAVQEDDHYFTVLRYVERNALRVPSSGWGQDRHAAVGGAVTVAGRLGQARESSGDGERIGIVASIGMSGPTVRHRDMAGTYGEGIGVGIDLSTAGPSQETNCGALRLPYLKTVRVLRVPF